jgi:hypothetical protein
MKWVETQQIILQQLCSHFQVVELQVRHHMPEIIEGPLKLN